MPKKYLWPTAGLQKYSERLKVFIHERCTCYPQMDDDMFEVPEFMVIDPLIRRPSKFKLSFADDFPYTRFPDDEFENRRKPCTCKLCPVCTCNQNLKPFPHYVLKREEMPQWTQRGVVRFKKPKSEEPPESTADKGVVFRQEEEPEKTAEKTEASKTELDGAAEIVEKGEEQAEPKSLEMRKTISAFSFDDDPNNFPFL